jgi:hypothetical protein
MATLAMAAGNMQKEFMPAKIRRTAQIGGHVNDRRRPRLHEDPQVTAICNAWFAERQTRNTVPVPITILESGEQDQYDAYGRRRFVQRAQEYIVQEPWKFEDHGTFFAVDITRLNGGKPLVLLLDKTEEQLRLEAKEPTHKSRPTLPTSSMLYLTGGQIYVRYRSVAYPLLHWITARKTDYYSVKLRNSGDGVLDCRMSNLEIRTTTEQKKAARKLDLKAKRDFDKPNRLIYFGHEELLQPYDDVIENFTTDATIARSKRPAGNQPGDAPNAVTKLAYGREKTNDDGEELRTLTYRKDNLTSDLTV